jgi:hypothetical protein
VVDGYRSSVRPVVGRRSLPVVGRQSSVVGWVNLGLEALTDDRRPTTGSDRRLVC